MSDTPKPIKTLRSYNAHAAFLYECDHDEIGDVLTVREIPRRTDIPSPYSYSPGWPVYRWNGQDVIVREIKHRTYAVFAV